MFRKSAEGTLDKCTNKILIFHLAVVLLFKRYTDSNKLIIDISSSLSVSSHALHNLFIRYLE